MPLEDPKEAAPPTPPFPGRSSSRPGAREMRPLADHGEETYVGHGRLGTAWR